MESADNMWKTITNFITVVFLSSSFIINYSIAVQQKLVVK